MSDYRYTSTEERIYADRALVVSPGDIVDWPDGPPADGHWQPTDETRAELERLAAERAAADEAEQKQADEQQSPDNTAPERRPAKTAAKTAKE